MPISNWRAVRVRAASAFLFASVLLPTNLPASPERRPAPPPSRAAESPERNPLVEQALSYRGTRYVRGGTSRSGFDCSGFTRYLYLHYGIYLPRTSRDQFQRGTPIARKDLRSGDLVFFSRGGKRISHVAIYIGDGRIVHAASSRQGVRVDQLDSISRRYAGARRIPGAPTSVPTELLTAPSGRAAAGPVSTDGQSAAGR